MYPNDFRCDLCGRETFGVNLCKECAKTLIINDKSACPICGRKSVRPEICNECKSSPPRYKRATSVFVYRDGAVELIRKFKSGGAYLKEYFADKICEKLKPDEYDCTVGVPQTRKVIRWRGYNQSELLARSVSERLGVPYVKGALIKVKETAEQKGLTKKMRVENLKGCFKVVKRDEIAGKRVLVVDDIMTTGATADEMSVTLIKAGAACVYLATVASVEYNRV